MVLFRNWFAVLYDVKVFHCDPSVIDCVRLDEPLDKEGKEESERYNGEFIQHGLE